MRCAQVAGLACAFSILASIAAPARAAVITFDLNTEFSGATPPAGAAPWLRATFDDGGGSGSVTMTLTALNLINQEFTFNWFFNLDPALNPNSLVFSAPAKVGAFADPAIATGVNAFQADGDGLYDIRLEFDNAPPANRFGPGDAVTYTITGIPTLTANSFNFLSAPAGGSGPFPTAAHVGGIGGSGDLSGWVTVPEPVTLGVLMLGVLPLSRATRRRV
jgi:hypothetical protein